MEFADPDYGTPVRVDLLLRCIVFNKAVVYGRRFGPFGSPSAFKTRIGWVLNGEVSDRRGKSTAHVCCVAIDDDILRGF